MIVSKFILAYLNKLLVSQKSRALDSLSDFTCNSTFSQSRAELNFTGVLAGANSKMEVWWWMHGMGDEPGNACDMNINNQSLDLFS